MSIGSFLLARACGLPPALCGARRQRGLNVPMRDGVMLETEHYAPRLPGRHPTLLMRVPYGLRGFATVAECYAERGFNVLLQACRGTGRSGGDFDPFGSEREDGLATLDWLSRQDWYDGRLGTTGPSYLGYAQWAISDALPPHAAMATKVTSAEFRSIVFPGGALHLGLWLSWLQTVEGLRKSPLLFGERMLLGDVERRTAKVAMTLPLADADLRAVGHPVAFWRRWMREAIGNDAFWAPLDHRHRLGPATPPNHFVSGWYDFMLDQLLRDYRTLVEAGHRPYLTIGPWFHVSEELQRISIRETLIWMRAILLGDRADLRERPVRVFIGGLGEWRDWEAWPPAPPVIDTWFFGNGQMSRDALPAGEPERYRYDPADPTPNLGGAIFAFTGAGPVDNGPLERRGDVLVMTGEPLDARLTVLGNAKVSLRLGATTPTADLFVRLCDVDPQGVSTVVCDGFRRFGSADTRNANGCWDAAVSLHATAYQFGKGHRLRIVVASGAHPRYARNTGTEEPLAEATSLVAADITVMPGGRLELPTGQHERTGLPPPSSRRNVS